MIRWPAFTLLFAIGLATACGGSDRRTDTAVDAQGNTATGGTGPSGAPGVPPAGAEPPTTPNSEPSNVPPESSLSPRPRAHAAGAATLPALAVPARLRASAILRARSELSL